MDSNGPKSGTDVENNASRDGNRSNSIVTVPSYNTTTRPFIGRVGGNQGFVLDRHNAANAEILKEQPDSAPCMTLREQFDLRGFRSLGLWKAALIEGVGPYLPLSIQQSKLIHDPLQRRLDAHLRHNMDQYVPLLHPHSPNLPIRTLRQRLLYRPPCRRRNKLVPRHAPHFLSRFRLRSTSQSHHHHRHIFRSPLYPPSYGPLRLIPNRGRSYRRTPHPSFLRNPRLQSWRLLVVF
jgi:hypothetical protein